jgi:hypothetical protein
VAARAFGGSRRGGIPLGDGRFHVIASASSAPFPRQVPPYVTYLQYVFFLRIRHVLTLPIYDDTSASWAGNLGSGGPTAPQWEARERETREREKNRIKPPHNF